MAKRSDPDGDLFELRDTAHTARDFLERARRVGNELAHFPLQSFGRLADSSATLGQFLVLLALADQNDLAEAGHYAAAWQRLRRHPADLGVVLTPMLYREGTAAFGHHESVVRLQLSIEESLLAHGPRGFRRHGIADWTARLVDEGNQQLRLIWSQLN